MATVIYDDDPRALYGNKADPPPSNQPHNSTAVSGAANKQTISSDTADYMKAVEAVEEITSRSKQTTGAGPTAIYFRTRFTENTYLATIRVVAARNVYLVRHGKKRKMFDNAAASLCIFPHLKLKISCKSIQDLYKKDYWKSLKKDERRAVSLWIW